MPVLSEREVAWRVFATEFKDATVSITGDTERSPNYVLTHTGAKCNRVFVVGVVTEVESVGEDLWRARIADPTGAFIVYAGQYQPEAAIFLQELDVPEYVALVGKARAYEPEAGVVYTSLRPEEVNRSDSSIRDRWVVDTAELTLARIEAMRLALDSGKQGAALKQFMLSEGIHPELADGIVMAIEHYDVNKEYLSKLECDVIEAVTAIIPAGSADEGVKEIILGLMDEMGDGAGVSYSKLLEAAVGAGLCENEAEDAVAALMNDGLFYEPRIGILKRV